MTMLGRDPDNQTKKKLSRSERKKTERQEEREARKVEKQRDKNMKRSQSLSLESDMENNRYELVLSMDPDLFTAAIEGDILELVRAMERGPADRQLDFPAGCIQVSPQKNTTLHIATEHGHHEIVNLMCKDLPFFIGEKNTRAETALHIAARTGDTLMVRLLISMKEGSTKAILGAKNEDGNTALHEALRYRHEKVAWLLIDKNRDMMYPVNKEGKSILYLAAEAGYPDMVKVVMDNPLINIYSYKEDETTKTKSAVHAAIHGRNLDVLKIMCERDESSFVSRCEEGRNPLHSAASINYHEGVGFLLERFCCFAYQRDKKGCFPIHVAATKGYVDIVDEILRHCPDAIELLNQQGQNMLHVAAKYGRASVVDYVVGEPTLRKLLNERDILGNTPLHLATLYQQPKVVRSLSMNKRVHLDVLNRDGISALDIAEGCDMHTETATTAIRKRLTWLALRLAGAKHSHSRIPRSGRHGSLHRVRSSVKLENYKEKVTAILLVSTLVATVTFSAGFTIPGGNNNSGSGNGNGHQHLAGDGEATLLMSKMFYAFVICDTVAMYSSIIVAIILIWSQLGDLGLVLFALKVATPLLGLALTMTSIAFMAGMYLVVTQLSWLANGVVVMGALFMVVFAALFTPLCCPAPSSTDNYVFKGLLHLSFHVLSFAFERFCDEHPHDKIQHDERTVLDRPCMYNM